MRPLYILPSLLILVQCGKIESDSNLTRNNKVNSLLDSSLDLIRDQAFKKARHCLDTARLMAVEINDSVGLSKVLNNYGLLNYRQGNYQEGLKYFRQSLQIDRNMRDSSRMGSCLKNIGICYRQMGLYQRALNFYLESLTISQQMSDLSEIASVNNSIGNLYNILDDFSQAREYLNTALFIWSNLNDESRLLLAKNNLANSLLGQDSVFQAIKIYKEVIAQKEKIGDKASIAISLNNLGEAYVKAGELINAKEAFNKALQLRISINNSKGIAIVSNNLAQLALLEEDLRSAKVNVFRALTILKQLPPNEEKLNSLSILKTTQRLEQNYAEALATDDRIDEMNEMLFQVEKLKVFDRLNDYERNLLQSEKEKAEQETRLQQKLNQQQQVIIWVITLALGLSISLIVMVFKGKQIQKRQNKELGLKNLAIQELNNKLKVLLDDVKHRKQNDFNRLIGTIEEIEEQYQNLSGLLSPLYSAILATSDIDDFLDNNSYADQIDLRHFLTVLIEKLKKIHKLDMKEVAFNYNIDPLNAQTKIGSTLAIIISELVSNSVKYGISTRKKPNFELDLSLKKDYCIFSFSDNGDDESFLDRLQNCNSLGWSILNRLIRSLNGSLRVERKDDLSSISFSFSLENP